MNLIEVAPLWLVLLLVGAVVAAALEDAARLRISNITSGIVAVAALAAMVGTGPSLSLWQNFAIFVLVLVLGTAAFAGGLFGGGDVKLFAAISLWLDLRGGMRLLIAVVLAGGVVAICYIAARFAARRPQKARKDRRVPYGIAIAAGTLLSVGFSREWLPAHHRSAADWRTITSVRVAGSTRS